jgi:hypothetical protein
MRIAEFLLNDMFDISICNLHPVESSAGGLPQAAFHRAGLKSAIDLNHWIGFMIKILKAMAHYGSPCMVLSGRVLTSNSK